MQIKQFEDEHLAHFSYTILSDCGKKIILIDPARNPAPYIAYAKENVAQITGVIETHPHADFVSSHLEFYETAGATIYTSALAEAQYPHQPFDEGQQIQIGNIILSAMNTPGHSPDSICILLAHKGEQKALFTGDTLFIGDCGRPDLRPGSGDAKAAAKHLAKQMYSSLRSRIMPLNDTLIVYPAHGAGTLCGKVVSRAGSSTIGEEKRTNWSLQPQAEAAFTDELLTGQPFVPAYFSYDVKLNKKGAAPFENSLRTIKTAGLIADVQARSRLQKEVWIIDIRDEAEYKKGHLSGAINIMQKGKFETWLGTIIKPEEPFYIAASNETDITEILARIASIGYESQVKEAFVTTYNEVVQKPLDIPLFLAKQKLFTIVDVRNHEERNEKKIFAGSLHIPLAELREKANTIPVDKPIVVHCASGFRSAAGSSLLRSVLQHQTDVYDLGIQVKQFIQP